MLIHREVYSLPRSAALSPSHITRVRVIGETYQSQSSSPTHLRAAMVNLLERGGKNCNKAWPVTTQLIHCYRLLKGRWGQSRKKWLTEVVPSALKLKWLSWPLTKMQGRERERGFIHVEKKTFKVILLIQEEQQRNPEVCYLDRACMEEHAKPPLLGN